MYSTTSLFACHGSTAEFYRRFSLHPREPLFCFIGCSIQLAWDWIVLFGILVPLGSTHKEIHNANGSIPPGPLIPLQGWTNEVREPMQWIFCFVLFLTDFMMEEKRVKRPKSRDQRPYVPSWARGVDAHAFGLTGGHRTHVLGKVSRRPRDLPTEQSGPIQLGSQLQRPVSGR